MPWRSDGLTRRAAERLAALTSPPPLGGWVPEQSGPRGSPGPAAGEPPVQTPVRTSTHEPDGAPAQASGASPADAAPYEQPTAARTWLLGRSQTILVVAGCALALLAALAWLWLGRARPLADPVDGSAAAAPLAPASTVQTGTPLPEPPAGAAPATPSGAAGAVVVDVAGKVQRPGVVTLPAGSRVLDALTAAGGARRGVDVTELNLARPLVDGEQIRVGLPPAPAGADPAAAAPGPGGTSGAPAGQPGPLDLNTATAADLEELPGVGPVLAERIIAWREQHGRFSSVEELDEVSGIGPKVFAELRPLVRV